MGMNAAQLNRRIQFHRVTLTPDGMGGFYEHWTDQGEPIFASRRDVSDAERLIAGGLFGKLVCRFVIRASAFGRGIRRSDRITHEGMTFAIDGIKEVPPGRDFLEITATSEGTL